MNFNPLDTGITRPAGSNDSTEDLQELANITHITKDAGDQQGLNLAFQLPKKNPQTQFKETYQSVEKYGSERRPAILARQIMSAPVRTLFLQNSLQEAWLFFKKYHVQHAPILNDLGELAGILSDRDLFKASSTLDGTWTKDIIPATVQDIMNTPVLTAKPDSEIRTITRTMFEKKVGAMPILNDQGTVVGILTRNDILRTVMNNTPLELWI